MPVSALMHMASCASLRGFLPTCAKFTFSLFLCSHFLSLPRCPFIRVHGCTCVSVHVFVCASARAFVRCHPVSLITTESCRHCWHGDCWNAVRHCCHGFQARQAGWKEPVLHLYIRFLFLCVCACVWGSPLPSLLPSLTSISHVSLLEMCP